ncbi:substrate-binding domain-containing protein, partial [Peribacillus simplex]|uniref:substrate-binding domain-containing protein n=1 Tax=Peribacillus simplex TaxID=1478 RepID=UPI001E56FF67
MHGTLSQLPRCHRISFECTGGNRHSKPDDIAVIGIDDVPYASFYTPTITTVNQPAIEMANLAAELLLS